MEEQIFPNSFAHVNTTCKRPGQGLIVYGLDQLGTCTGLLSTRLHTHTWSPHDQFEKQPYLNDLEDGISWVTSHGSPDMPVNGSEMAGERLKGLSGITTLPTVF